MAKDSRSTSSVQLIDTFQEGQKKIESFAKVTPYERNHCQTNVDGPFICVALRGIGNGLSYGSKNGRILKLGSSHHTPIGKAEQRTVGWIGDHPAAIN